MSDDPVFDAAGAVLLGHEGGLVDDPNDPGGLTNFGITLRDHPDLGADGIRALTPNAALAIYKRDFWDRYSYGEMAPAIGGKLLDMAANMGAASAHTCLQRALRACGTPVAEDGVLGPATRAAANVQPPDRLLAAFRSELAAHYRLIVAAKPSDAEFESGWLARAYS